FFFFLLLPRPPRPPLFPYTTLFRSSPTAANIDPNLVNPWGMSRSSGSPWWISDNGTSLATLYDATGAPKQLVVSIPLPNGQPGGDRKSTRLNSSHLVISYAVFCLKK